MIINVDFKGIPKIKQPVNVVKPRNVTTDKEQPIKFVRNHIKDNFRGFF